MKMPRFALCLALGAALVSLSACAQATEGTAQPASPASQATAAPSATAAQPAPVQTGLIREQILEGETGTIPYSYYLPEGYDGETPLPMVVVMPGYDRMWFGEESSGSNLDWSGFLCWTELPQESIVVSAQLTDWGETSAQQAIELTEHFLGNFAVDADRVYAAGYSAGGETLSQAVALRPDLYAAYLHAASQWDGAFAPVAESGVAVYIFMAEGDEYYGPERAREAYDGLRSAYLGAGGDRRRPADPDPGRGVVCAAGRHRELPRRGQRCV